MLTHEIIDNMKNIVDNCMGDSKPACQSACPMQTDVKGYIKFIGEGNGEGAISLIREKLFLPKTLGRICAHPCESNCRRGAEDSSLSVANLKRYAADNFDNPENWDIKKDSATGKKVAIIGAGPAGAQAAMDLAKKGHEVTIYDKLPVLGGMMRVGIPEYRLPREVIDGEYSILEKLGVTIKLGVEIGKDIDFEELKSSNDAVVVAVGRQAGRIDTRLENADAEGIYHAAEYLKEISLTRNFNGAGKKVAVIGGGDVAMDCARSSLRLSGVEEVYSVCLEPTYEAMASSMHEIHGAIAEGINFNLAMGTDSIIKDESGRVSGLVVKKCLSIFDEEGGFAPKFDENSKTTIDVDTLVFAIGQGVDASFDKTDSMAKRCNGTFEADALTMQSIKDEKVFVAGDCASAFIVIGAMAEGRRASISVDRFLKGEDLKADRTLEAEGSSESKLNLPTKYLPEGWDAAEKVARRSVNEMDASLRIKSFDEVEATYTRAQAEEEANRCLQCTCKLCMKECLMLNEFTDCPKTLFNEYLEKGYENMDMNIAFSCNECSQCTIKCPNDFQIRENFMEMRKEYVKANDGLSPLDGHTALDDGQELECSKKYSITVEGKKKTKYVLVPGCTVPASNPSAVEDTLIHMREVLGEDVGAVLQCCAKPTLIIGEEELFEERFSRVQKEIDSTGAEVIVTLCPSCYMTYDKYSTQKVVSYWDLMKDEIGIPKKQKGIGADSDVVFNIHDACPTRGVSSHHESIRWILDELGYAYEEMNNNRENTRCCGVGGMLGCINENLYKDIVNRRAADATRDNIISYCGSCRGSMELGGLDSLHVLDLIHKGCYMKSHAKKRSADYGFHNRLDTKKRLKKYSDK